MKKLFVCSALLFLVFLNLVGYAQPTSALANRATKKKEAERNPFSILLFRPTYVLPYYYTASPYQSVYRGNTPDDQKIQHQEFKAQFSFQIPIIKRLFNRPNLSIDAAYTQLMYWQVYAKSQYFRETNYQPELFIEDLFDQHHLLRLSINHQSNGRGGELERSWNRVILTGATSGQHWLAQLELWTLIFKSQSSGLHNPKIAHFLGYDRVTLAYRWHRFVFSARAQNLESLLRRGNYSFTISFKLHDHLHLYAQYFNGYGQSLIEYDHRTQAAGIGIALNDWL